MGALASLFAFGSVHAQTATKTKLCREIAANKWLLDYTMVHGNVSHAQQLEAIRQVTEYSELVRKACGDNRINNEILQAANKGGWPDWIDDEVNDLLSKL
jgi:hypothetical protein